MSNGIWSVEHNLCDCHPETCNCNGFVLTTPEGKRHSTYFKRSTAEEIALRMNLTDSAELQVAEAINTAIDQAKLKKAIAYLITIDGERILTFEKPSKADNCESVIELVAAREQP